MPTFVDPAKPYYVEVENSEYFAIRTLRAREVRLEGVVRMLIGCVEDVGVNDEFEEELEAARKVLEEE